MSDDAIAKKMKTPGTVKPTVEDMQKMLWDASREVTLEKIIKASALLAQSRVLDYGGHPLHTPRRKIGQRSRANGVCYLMDALPPEEARRLVKEWEANPTVVCPLFLPGWVMEIRRTGHPFDPFEGYPWVDAVRGTPRREDPRE